MSLVYHSFSHSGWTNFRGARQIEIDNKLITALNVKNRIKLIKQWIKNLPDEPTKLDEINHKALFSDIVINENSSVDFVIKFTQTRNTKPYVILPSTVDYVVRKTVHTIKHRIIVL